jgi:predicted choloylglycine hydrolase
MVESKVEISANSFYQAGKRQVEVFSEEISKFFARISSFSIVDQIKPRILPFSPVYRLLKWHASRNYLESIQKYAPKNFEFLKGLADSSEHNLADFLLVSSANLYLMRSIYYSRKLLNRNLLPLMPETGDFCSCLMGRDEDGNPFLFKNLDFMGDLETTIFIRDLKVEGSQRIISQAFQMMPHVIQGMNDSGLVMSLNNTYGMNKPVPGIPISIAISEVLLDSKNTEEAIVQITKMPIANSGVVNVIDSNGDFASIEISNGEYEVIRRRQKEKTRIYTNFFKSKKMKAVDRHRFIELATSPSERDLNWKQSADSRYEQINNYISSNIINPTNLMELSRFCGNFDKPNNKTVCMEGLTCTIASAVFFPKSRKAYLTKGNPRRESFQEYEL